MRLRSRCSALSFALAGSLALAACGEDDPMGIDEEEHGDADQVQLVMNGAAIAAFTFATNTWVGELEVETGQETPHIDVNFLDGDGDVIDWDADFYLAVEVEDESIAEFEQDTPGEFGGHLHGGTAGETNVRFSLMHGTVGSGHADLVTDWVHVHVEALAPPAFQVVDLGTVGGSSSSALGLNEGMHVVGRGPDAEGMERAFLWQDGTMEALSDFGRGARAYGIDDSGRIAGSAPTLDDPDGEYQAFYYDPETGMRPLGTLGGSRSRAFALNNAGQVAGFARTPDGRFRAFLWTEESGMVDILADQGGTENSFAFGINDEGEVVGSSGPDDTHASDFAFLWRDGEVINLGTFGGASAFAQGINEDSQVTGGAMTADGETHAFLWDNGQLTDLGTFGGPNSSGRKVNNRGWVVGVADLPDETEHAFLWIDGDLHDLNDLIPADSGWELNVAADVNDQGFIVGQGTIAGESRAFLLTPES